MRLCAQRIQPRRPVQAVQGRDAQHTQVTPDAQAAPDPKGEAMKTQAKLWGFTDPEGRAEFTLGRPKKNWCGRLVASVDSSDLHRNIAKILNLSPDKPVRVTVTFERKG